MKLIPHFSNIISTLDFYSFWSFGPLSSSIPMSTESPREPPLPQQAMICNIFLFVSFFTPRLLGLPSWPTPSRWTLSLVFSSFQTLSFNLCPFSVLLHGVFSSEGSWIFLLNNCYFLFLISFPYDLLAFLLFTLHITILLNITSPFSFHGS